MKQETTALLKQIQFFSSLSEDELEQTSSKVVLRSFNKSAVILREEDTNEYMYIILSGRVKVFRVTEDGKETILAFHGAGDSFGEMSLIDGRTEPAMVVATEESSIALISKINFFSLLFSQQRLMEQVLMTLCTRVRDSWNQIQMLNFKNASERVKMAMLTLLESHGMPEDKSVAVELKLTHQTIADMTGLTRETVTRVLDKWQRDGIISTARNRLVCLKPHFFVQDFAGQRTTTIEK